MSNSIKLITAITLFLWASAFVAIREALTTFSPGGLALLRFSIASIAIAIIFFFLPSRQKVSLKDAAIMLACGMIGIGVYNLTLNYGELSINAGMACFIISQSPLITVLLGVLLLKEEINAISVCGFLISIIGVTLIAIGLEGGFTWDQSLNFIIIAACASGFYTFSQKPFVNKYHPIEVTAFYIWGGTLFLLWYLPNLQQDLNLANVKTIVATSYLGVFPAVLALMMWSYVLRKVPASRAGSFLYFMAPLATILGWIFLGEVPALLSIIGGLIAIGGVWVVNHSYRVRTGVVVET